MEIGLGGVGLILLLGLMGYSVTIHFLIKGKKHLARDRRRARDLQQSYRGHKQ